MKITINSNAAKLQEWLKSKNACKGRMDFYIGKSVKEGLSQAPVDDLAWLLQFEEAVALMTDAKFERVVKNAPWNALEYEHACKRLNDAQFDECVKNEPWDALAYQHACKRLTDAQFDECVKHAPGYALAYKHAFERMEKMKNENHN